MPEHPAGSPVYCEGGGHSVSSPKHSDSGIQSLQNKAQAYEALAQYGNCIQCYRKALSVAPAGEKDNLEMRINSMKRKMQNLSTVGVEFLKAMVLVRGKSNWVPKQLDTPERVNQFRHDIFMSPWWKEFPIPPHHFLFIPEDGQAPVRSICLPPVEPETFMDWQRRVLGCEHVANEFLYVEDWDLYYNHRDTHPYGSQVGRIHISYEMFMDDDANPMRKPNKRASDLLKRPKTHGPILVRKNLFMKLQEDRSFDLVGWEPLTEENFKTDLFNEKRNIWPQTHKKRAEDLISQGYTVVSLELGDDERYQ